MAGVAGPRMGQGAAGGDGDDSLYPIAVLIDELRNEDVQVLESGRGAEAGSAGRVVGKGKARPGAGEARGLKAGTRSRNLTGRRGEIREGFWWLDPTGREPLQHPLSRPAEALARRSHRVRGGCGGTGFRPGPSFRVGRWERRVQPWAGRPCS